jgi:hypothetical protein
MPQCIIADAENLRCGSCEYIHQLSVRHQSEDERECGCKATNDSETLRHALDVVKQHDGPNREERRKRHGEYPGNSEERGLRMVRCV